MELEMNHNYKLSHLWGCPSSWCRVTGASPEQPQSCRTAANLTDDKWGNMILPIFLFLTVSLRHAADGDVGGTQ